MGQYYKPINLDNKQWLSPWACDNGAKLMEHSWIGNNFVGAVMSLLSEGGAWFKSRIAWAGDYYGDSNGEIDHYGNCSDSSEINSEKFMPNEEQEKAILINHSKKMYVRYDEMPICGDGWTVNPLPLLTALGNNRGGGDYHDQYPDFDKVGIWAGDVLSIAKTVPNKYKKLTVKFKN